MSRRRTKRALVTGSAGLIGSKCVEMLCKDEWTVIGIDNDMRAYFFGKEASTATVASDLLQHKTYKHFSIDIRDCQKVKDIFKDEGPFDIIVHTAAQPSHDWAAREPLTDFSVNALATVQLLDIYRELSPEASFVFTSTNKVYGDTPNKLNVIELETRYEVYDNERNLSSVSEEMSIDNSKHSIFGASKVAADVMVQEYGKYWGLNTAVFRGGCLTGPNHKGAELHGFLSYLVKRIVRRQSYNIFGYKGKQVRDNIHSEDLVNMFLHYHDSPRPGEVYNAGGGRENSISILEAIDNINFVLRQEAGREEWGDSLLSYSEMPREGDHIWYITNLRKFQSHYPSWKINHTLDKVLSEMVINQLKSDRHGM